jgi:hypothetical protein
MLFLHDREDTSGVLTTKTDKSLMLTETRKQIESAWSQAETAHFMLKARPHGMDRRTPVHIAYVRQTRKSQ